MIDTKALMAVQKEKSDKLCQLLGIQVKQISTPNSNALPVLPNLYNPFNFVQLYEVLMHNVMFDNKDYFDMFQEGKSLSAVDWLIDECIRYMSMTDEEFKVSQDIIRKEVQVLGWFSIK